MTFGLFNPSWKLNTHVMFPKWSPWKEHEYRVLQRAPSNPQLCGCYWSHQQCAVKPLGDVFQERTLKHIKDK